MPNSILSVDEQKKLAARQAIDDLFRKGILHSGMRIGLGTGSTAMPAVYRLAQLIGEGKLSDIRAVSTSFQTTIACEELGIPVFSLNAREIGGNLDLSIDGADEIDPDNCLIKGGGAALLLEKIVAYNSERFVIVADESKAVSSLGTAFPLPVEVVPEARVSVTGHLSRLGATATIRHAVRKAGPIITDNGNIILDCLWEATSGCNARKMEAAINSIAGVVENGFFTGIRPSVYLAHANGSVEQR